MATAAAQLSPLTNIIGFDVHTVLPELMHAGCLGVCPILIACVIKELCAEGMWGAMPAAGAWQDKMALTLYIAYDCFCRWAKDNCKTHTQKRFTPGRLGLKTLASWPELKCKSSQCIGRARMGRPVRA